jgi:hypothetical protein
MKFLSLAQVFAAFAAVAASPQKSNLRKLSVDEPVRDGSGNDDFVSFERNLDEQAEDVFADAKPAPANCQVRRSQLHNHFYNTTF